ncbi:hypothetical protein CPB83DRAFT_894355 [Crepidotus variabilis]|uniref:Uncharacterized protein n=1 Tax=Crepidotus variabilis TaxID=179855 RepID=A0A9P6JPV4_9AGAR|nr:hypothetical protein CPB83DRAFT_894355 [Crepidotus variabilis]
MAAQLRYFQNIPTIHDKHPEIPPFYHGLNLNQALQVDDVYSLEDLQQARATASALKGLHLAGVAPEVNAEIIHTAETRSATIEAAHSVLKFSAPNFQQMAELLIRIDNQLVEANQRMVRIEQQAERMDQRMARMERKVDVIETNTSRLPAQITNLRIIGRNNRLQGAVELDAPQKEVPGSGRALALRMAPNQDVRRQLEDEYPPNHPAALLGSSPPEFIVDPENYQHIDILKLILFYNDRFGVLVTDTLPTRMIKLRTFLTQF